MPISVPILNPLLYGTTEVNFLNFQVDPNELYFPWIMGSANLGTHNQKLVFPAFDAQPEFASFTEFQFEALIQSPIAYPTLLVNGENEYIGTLGTAIAGSKYEKFVDLSFSNLNLLSPGSYDLSVVFKVTAIPPPGLLLDEPITFPRRNISVKRMPVRLDVVTAFSEPPLEIAYPGIKQKLFFNYIIGESVPTAKSIFFFPGDAVVVTSADAELNFVQTSIDANYGKIDVSLSEISGFTAGSYNYSFTVESGTNSKEIEVILQVAASGASSFNLIPEEITMNVISGSGTSYIQSFNVNCVGAWNVVSAIPDWLSVSELSGSGNSIISLSPKDTYSLVSGTYIYPLIIENLGVKKVMNLTFVFSSFLKTPFKISQLYFTKDLDFMTFDTPKTNVYIQLTVNVKVFQINTNIVKDYVRVLDLPLYKGKVDFHVGTVVEQLMDDITSLSDYVPSFEMNYSKAQSQPVQVFLSYQEKVYPGEIADPGVVYYFGQLPPFKMLKGNKPYLTNSQLSLLTTAQQEFIRITPNSVIGTSFTYPGTPHLLVRKNGAIIDDFVIQSFSSPPNPKMVFSYYRFANDFKPGDIVEIVISTEFETRTSRYLVFQEGLESTYFFFENENGQVEPFEFTGRRRKSSEMKNTLGSKFKNLKGFETKIDSSEVESFMINTGQLSKTEHVIVRSIAKSLNVWVSIDHPSGPYLKVDSTTTKITQSDTSVNEEDYNVEFTILPN